MANIKFSQFTQKTTLGTVDFLVGYTGAQNIQIDPVDLLSGYSQGTGAAGQVTFFSAASTVTGDNNLYWDNTNKRLGVGTTSPDRKFEVASTGTGEMCITGATGSRLYFRPTTSYSPGGNFGILVTGSGGSSYLSTMTITGYNNGLNTVMTLKGDGNVGIGTATPVAKLQVEGSFISSGISQLGTTGANVLLTSSSGGSVGIGTSSPAAGLQVAKGSSIVPAAGASTASACFGNNVSGDDYGVVLGADTSGSGYISAQRTDGTATAYNLYLQPNGGNVGIGTTSPSYVLDVNGAARIDGILRVGTTGTSSEIKLIDSNGKTFSLTNGSSGNNNFAIRDDNTNEYVFVIERQGNTGNVGIGTSSPQGILNIFKNSSTAYDDTSDPGQASSGSSLTIQNGNTTVNSFSQVNMQVSSDSNRAVGRIVTIAKGGASSDMAFVTENAGVRGEKMRILANGNVGIGTTSATAKLNSISPDGSTDSLKLGRSDASSFWNFNHAGNDLRIYNSDGSGSDILIGVNAGGTIYDNKVGIGTTSPSAPLGFGKSTYGDVDTEAFYRVKIQDQGGVANDVGIGQTETGSLGFNVTAGKKYTFSTGTSGTLLELSAVSASFLNIPKIILKLSTNNTRASFDGSGNYLNIRAADNDTSKPQMWLGNGTDEGIYANAAIHYWRNTSSTNYATLSSAGLDVKQGDVEVETSSNGLILKSPDGTRYRVTVANGGTLSVSAV